MSGSSRCHTTRGLRSILASLGVRPAFEIRIWRSRPGTSGLRSSEGHSRAKVGLDSRQPPQLQTIFATRVRGEPTGMKVHLRHGHPHQRRPHPRGPLRRAAPGPRRLREDAGPPAVHDGADGPVRPLSRPPRHGEPPQRKRGSSHRPGEGEPQKASAQQVFSNVTSKGPERDC